MVLETIQDPGNLGTIIRAGEGAGITGIVMNHDTADIYNPKVIRSTMGSIFRMPFVYADDLQDACLLMKNRGVRLFAAHLKGMNNYDQEDYTDNVGFLIGNEANGLTEETTSLADCLVKDVYKRQIRSCQIKGTLSGSESRINASQSGMSSVFCMNRSHVGVRSRDSRDMVILDRRR